MSKFLKSNPVIIIIALLVISAVITGIVYGIISLIKPKNDPFSNITSKSTSAPFLIANTVIDDNYTHPPHEGKFINIIGNKKNYTTVNAYGTITATTPQDFLILLEYINPVKKQPALFVNLESLKEGSTLKLSTPDKVLNIFWRYDPVGLNTAGNLLTALRYYDKGYKKILNGVGKDYKNAYAIVNDANQMVDNDTIKPIIVVSLGQNTFALGATTIQYMGGDYPFEPQAMWISSDGKPGVIWMANIDPNNNLLFDQPITTKYDDTFIMDINANTKIAKFQSNLFFGGNGTDDKFLVNSSKYTKIQQLINTQLTIDAIQAQF